MDNGHKIILDLCGGTGSWSLPYKESGYDVRLVTLPNIDVFSYDPPYNVYGVLAAPTCTHFSLARTTAKTPRDLAGGFLLVKRCLDIIWKSRLSGSLKFWALENPVGYLRQLLGKPPLTWQPCDFGDPYTKKTDLWGFYNLPKKSPIALSEEQTRDCHVNNRKLPDIPEGYVMPEGMNKVAVKRSITPSGFAKAFFKANQ